MSQVRGYLRLKRLVAMCCLLLLPAFCNAAPIVLNFDSWMTPQANYNIGTPILANAQLSNQYLAANGVTFSSSSAYVGVMLLGSGHATSGTNGLSGADASGNVAYGSTAPIIATFFQTSNTSLAGVTNFVSLRIDNQGSGANNSVTLFAYDILGNLLGSTTSNDNGGETLSVSYAGIHSVKFVGNGSTAVDDFSFNPVEAPPASAVPVPAGLYLAGIGSAVAYCFRRSFKKVAV